MPRINLPALHEGQREILRLTKSSPFRIVIRCGRRFGKTTFLERNAVKWAAEGKRVGWFGPQYRLNTPSYYRIYRMAGKAVFRASKNEQIIELKSGGLVEFWTLNDPDAGRSRFYDYVIIDEASLSKGLEDTWEQAIAPTLLDRKGSAIMAGTPKGVDDENYFYRVCTNKSLRWTEVHAPTSANPMLDPEAVARLIDEYPPLVYQQEYLAEFVDWRGSAFFSEDKLLENNRPVEIPRRVDTVFAVIDTAVKDGLEHDGTAVIYCATDQLHPWKLLILDWDVLSITSNLLDEWLPSVYLRCGQLAQECNARYGAVGVWIEDRVTGTTLLQGAKAKGLPAQALPEKLTTIGKEARAISASPHVHRGHVKLAPLAYDKVTTFREIRRNHLLAQVCGYRVGVKTPHGMDLLDCFTYAVLVSLGDSSGFGY